MLERMGFVIVCDNCGNRHLLPAADTLDEVRADARRKGLVIWNDGSSIEGKHFCNEDCLREFKGEICIHSWPRSGPNRFICVKCGQHRDNLPSC